GSEPPVETVQRMTDVAQGVELRRRLQIEGVDPVVAVALVVGEHMVLDGAPGSRRVRLERRERMVEAEPLSRADEPRGGCDPLGRQEVDGAELVGRTEGAPTGAGWLLIQQLVVAGHSELPRGRRARPRARPQSR